MIAKIKNLSSFLYISLFFAVSGEAFGATVIDRVKSAMDIGWLSALITSAFAMMAVKAIIEKWTAIFEGNDLFKNLTVIASLCGLTLWWKEIVGFCLNVA